MGACWWLVSVAGGVGAAAGVQQQGRPPCLMWPVLLSRARGATLPWAHTWQTHLQQGADECVSGEVNEGEDCSCEVVLRCLCAVLHWCPMRTLLAGVPPHRMPGQPRRHCCWDSDGTSVY
jgi:hypothetical protein